MSISDLSKTRGEFLYQGEFLSPFVLIIIVNMGCDTKEGTEFNILREKKSRPCQIQGNHPTVDFSPEMVYLGSDWKYIFYQNLNFHL